MKSLITTMLLAISVSASAQILKPAAISVAYFGETITHPGIKLGFTYHLKNWEKQRLKKGSEKVLLKSIDLTPTLGLFYHKDYQTGFFALSELSYSRQKTRGSFISLGLGAGYLRTFVPNTYQFDAHGEIEKIPSGYNYFLTNYFAVFGKDCSVKKANTIAVYFKPQFMYATPSSAKGVWYFALEIGVRYKLHNTQVLAH